MTAIAVDQEFIGAGQVYIDTVLIGATMGDNVFRVMQTVAAPVINGAGGKLARTDYHTELPFAELECTLIDLTDDNLGIMVPGLVSEAGSGADTGATVLTGPDQSGRRLGAADYHSYELRVPGADGSEASFRIALGITQSNADFTAADSEVPLGPRITIQSRIDPDDIEAKPWSIVRTPAIGS